MNWPREGGPRLALIDWMMPGLDGPGVCQEVRTRHNDLYVYIVLLTSKESSEDIVKGLEAGADDYLTKPCRPAELKARLHTGRRILQLEDKLVEAREGMRFKATHDPLTSLWDRGAILTLLRSELNRSERAHSPISLLLCDIDHFKSINDGYGHQTGDEVLEEVSTRLLDGVRSHDAVGRYGGEEFLVLLNGCSGEQLKERAEEYSRINQLFSFLDQSWLNRCFHEHGRHHYRELGQLNHHGAILGASGCGAISGKSGWTQPRRVCGIASFCMTHFLDSCMSATGDG